jgi:hypothetical protein
MKFEFVSREKGMKLADNPSITAIDVSSYSKTHPFLSPYTYGKDIELDVPMMPGEISHSVEGIWQGLKIINGDIDRKYFLMKPRKRRGSVSGHQFGDETLGIVEARKRIYLPTYSEYLNEYVDKEVFDDFLDTLINGRQVVFYDTESNGDIRIDMPLAHSAALATHMNFLLWDRIPEELRQPPYEDPRNELSGVI